MALVCDARAVEGAMSLRALACESLRVDLSDNMLSTVDSVIM
jgi:hypothetical protein